ncbi:MAG: hypothetical protein LUE23_11215 [Lachnospiraceae bacterium]|nr:hypothetical protein [Lachnospiraceae bacterium]
MLGIRFGETIRAYAAREGSAACLDLYAVGLGGKIEEMVRRELSGPGAVRETLRAYLDRDK